MSREFYPPRDVPLVLILMAFAFIALLGGLAYTSYTPLYSEARALFLVVMFLPLLTAPLVYYFGYTRGWLAHAFAYVAIALLAGCAAAATCYGNGRWDMDPAKELVVEVLSKQTREVKGGLSYRVSITLPGQRSAEFSVYRSVWEAVLGGESLLLEYHAGRFSIPWYSGAEAFRITEKAER